MYACACRLEQLPAGDSDAEAANVTLLKTIISALDNSHSNRLALQELQEVSLGKELLPKAAKDLECEKHAAQKRLRTWLGLALAATTQYVATEFIKDLLSPCSVFAFPC